MTSRAFLLIGFLIALLSASLDSQAETIPATQTWTPVNSVSGEFTPQAYGSSTYQNDVPRNCQSGFVNWGTNNSYSCSGSSCTSVGGSCNGKKTATLGACNYPASTGTTSTYTITSTTTDNGNCPVTATQTRATRLIAGCPSGTSFHNGQCSTSTYSCPANQGWTLNGTNCERPECPYARNPDGTCQGQCDGKSGQTAAEGYYTSPPSLACYNGCAATRSLVLDGSPGYNVLVNGVTKLYSKFNYSFADDGTGQGHGVSCSAISPALESSAPPTAENPTSITQSCGAGQTGQYLNGKFTCVNTQTGEKAAEGGVTQPKTTTSQTVTNPDNSTTTTETTTYPDGSKSIKVTTTPAPGSGGSTVIEETEVDADGKPIISGGAGGGTGPGDTAEGVKEGIDDYCTANPTASICQKSEAGGGGDCTNAPTCSGDAIQCQILQQQWKNRCETAKLNSALGEGNQFVTDLATVGETAMDGEPTDHTGNTTQIDVSGQISTTKFLTGGCLPDKVITGLPMGKFITIPFSTYCPYIEYFGMAMIALAMLGAARITGVF
jgi:hypothetical protein